MKKIYKIYEIVSGDRPSDYVLKEHTYPKNHINEFPTIKEAEKFASKEHSGFGLKLVILPVYVFGS